MSVESPLRMLVLEDSHDEARLIVREVERSGRTVCWRRVESEPDLRASLAESWDVVIADVVVPGFGGLEAVTIIRGEGLDLPVIMISGKVTEDAAVGALKAGAQDFVSKFNMSRLVPAIERELHDVAERRKRARAEASLRFVAESARLLAALPLVPEQIAAELARVVVPFLADWCVVEVMGEAADGRMTCEASACRDPSLEATLSELCARYGPNSKAPTAAAEAMRTGRSMLARGAAAVEARALDGPYRELLRRLGTSSMVAVPIVARGRLLGAMTLARTGLGTHDERDVEIAEIVATRAALHLDNARLYEQTRKAAAEAAKQAAAWEGVVSAMSDGILLFDARGEITYTNPAQQRFMRLTPDAARGLRVEDIAARLQLRHVDGALVPPTALPVHRALRGGQVIDEDLAVVVPETGERRVVCVSAAPLPGPAGSVAGVVAVVRDVSVRVELEQSKEQFLRMAAHELKSPVTVVRGHAERMLHGSAPLSADQRRAVVAILRGAERLERLADDLVYTTEIGLDRMLLVREAMDLPALVARVIDRLALASGADIRLLRADPCSVCADVRRIEKVLAILLDNACRYGEGRPIEVEVEADADAATVSVRDRGVGIPEAKQPHIFERFFRAHSDTPHDFGGIGVGLHIARAIVRAHGGALWFESELGRGSTFHVRLPLSAASPRGRDA